jgi:hypothetical protein
MSTSGRAKPIAELITYLQSIRSVPDLSADLLSKVVKEISDKEFALASDQKGSKQLQALIATTALPALQILDSILEQGGLEALTNQYCSHVVEEIVTKDPKGVRAMLDIVETNFGYLIRDRCATHVIRKLVKEMDGKALSDLIDHQISSDDFKLLLMHPQGSPTMQIILEILPAVFLEKFQNLNNDEIRELVRDPIGSHALEAVLKSVESCGNEIFAKILNVCQTENGKSAKYVIQTAVSNLNCEKSMKEFIESMQVDLANPGDVAILQRVASQLVSSEFSDLEKYFRKFLKSDPMFAGSRHLLYNVISLDKSLAFEGTSIRNIRPHPAGCLLASTLLDFETDILDLEYSKQSILENINWFLSNKSTCRVLETLIRKNTAIALFIWRSLDLEVLAFDLRNGGSFIVSSLFAASSGNCEFRTQLSKILVAYEGLKEANSKLYKLCYLDDFKNNEKLWLEKAEKSQKVRKVLDQVFQSDTKKFKKL